MINNIANDPTIIIRDVSKPTPKDKGAFELNNFPAFSLKLGASQSTNSITTKEYKRVDIMFLHKK